MLFFFFQAEDGIRDCLLSRGLGDVYKRQYQPSLSPEEVLSYRVGVSYEGDEPPRIGLRGTAKLYGSRVTLFYYLFRKPITFVRQLVGV